MGEREIEQAFTFCCYVDPPGMLWKPWEAVVGLCPLAAVSCVLQACEHTSNLSCIRVWTIHIFDPDSRRTQRGSNTQPGLQKFWKNLEKCRVVC